MRWQDREGSNNVEDARGGSGGGGGKPLGIIGLIILLIGAYNGVDLSGLVGGDQPAWQYAATANTPAAILTAGAAVV